MEAIGLGVEVGKAKTKGILIFIPTMGCSMDPQTVVVFRCLSVCDRPERERVLSWGLGSEIIFTGVMRF